jgi:RNA polymerase sigma-70 factor (ECF subfamily)
MIRKPDTFEGDAPPPSSRQQRPSLDAKVIPLITPASLRPTPERILDGLGDDELMHLASTASRRAIANDAFETLLLRYQGRVRNYCAKWSGSTARSGEMAQEVFVDLWRHRNEYQPSGRFQAYLFTLVRNRCRSDRRKVIVEKKLDIAETDHASADQLERLIDFERMHRLNEAVARLPAKLREALLLRYGANLEYGEVARIVDAPESTVRSRVFMAICQLKDWAREASL